MKPDHVVSVHFPKAAGTSLRLQLEALLGESMLLDYDHDPLGAQGIETVEIPSGKRLVHGHFHAGRYLSADAYRMTFLRHPVDNLISIYYFWKALPEVGNPVHTRFLHEHPSILEFAMYSGIRTLMSETYFGGFDMSRFDFIGFYETRNADIPRLSEELGLPLSSAYYENRTVETGERHPLDADNSIRRRLNDLLAADVAFYERLLCQIT